MRSLAGCEFESFPALKDFLEENEETLRELDEIIEEFVKHLEDMRHTVEHIGIAGNEMEDNLAKQAANDDTIEIIYRKPPKSKIATEIKEIGIQKWQDRWNKTTKGATKKSFFPSIKQRLKLSIPSTPEFIAVITGHCRTKSYLHGFHSTDDPTYTCGRGQQTVNHLIYECADTTQQRTSLMRDIRMNGGDWPVTCQQLVNSYLKRKDLEHQKRSENCEALKRNKFVQVRPRLGCSRATIERDDCFIRLQALRDRRTTAAQVQNRLHQDRQLEMSLGLLYVLQMDRRESGEGMEGAILLVHSLMECLSEEIPS
ncbi:hypothetical protein ANN_26949 [Periplaneta americana]|uniref:RNase H type-1 domain-containing protein n=1 Tax=Periplaneta americana TaxID=6978 RepID=A0ABQ8RWY3_PERAM|nr:hypothetical protein ANN_26949 [Periplaneta americana]